ncbi:FAD dependent oxidoreductase [compost metagenome]
MMPVCLAMGEAAGLAAALAASQAENDVHAVDVAFLRKRLKEEGAFLPDPEGEAVEVKTSER